MRVETSDGLVGWGEATLEGHTEAVEGVIQEFRDRFLGWNADNIEDIWQHGYRGGFYRGGPVLMVRAYRSIFKKYSTLAVWDRYDSPPSLELILHSGISKERS